MSVCVRGGGLTADAQLLNTLSSAPRRLYAHVVRGTAELLADVLADADSGNSYLPLGIGSDVACTRSAARLVGGGGGGDGGMHIPMGGGGGGGGGAAMGVLAQPRFLRLRSTLQRGLARFTLALDARRRAVGAPDAPSAYESLLRGLAARCGALTVLLSRGGGGDGGMHFPMGGGGGGVELGLACAQWARDVTGVVGAVGGGAGLAACLALLSVEGGSRFIEALLAGPPAGVDAVSVSVLRLVLEVSRQLEAVPDGDGDRERGWARARVAAGD